MFDWFAVDGFHCSLALCLFMGAGTGGGDKGGGAKKSALNDQKSTLLVRC